MNACESTFVHAVPYPESINRAMDESPLAQDLQVLGHRRLGQRELVEQFTPKTLLTFEEMAQDPHSCRVTQRFGQASELEVGLELGIQRRGWRAVFG